MAETKRTGGGHGRNHGYQRPKDMKGTFKKLMGYVGKYKGLLVLVAICLLISSAAGVATSYLLKPLLNDYIIPGDFPGLFKMLLVMGGMYLLSSLCSFAYARIMVHVAQHTVAALRQDLFNRLQQLSVSYYDRHQSGDLMSRFTNDIDTVSEMLNSSFASIISNVLTFVGTVVMMIVLNPWLTLITFLFLGLMGLVVKVIGGRSRANFQRQQAALGAVNGYIEEMISGQKVVKIFNHEEVCKESFDKINEELRANAYNAGKFSNMLGPINNNLGYVQYAVLAIFGGLICIKSDGRLLTLGSLMAFMVLSRSFNMPISQISNQINAIVMALAGAERIFALMDEEPEQDEGYVTLVNAHVDPDGTIHECPEHTGHWAWKYPHQTDGTVTYTELKGDITMEDVDFGYVPGKTVLHDVTLYAHPGQKIAFVGATGAGKTTITNLINRFYDIADGKIRYDGINVNKIAKPDLRHSLGIVLQETNLFTGTVMDNIRYGKLDATDEECIRAAKLANADDFITRLPDGYNTMLTANGGSLSQGQRQLIAIARAAVADPPVMILDEATSSIDTHTEALVQAGMDALMKGRTVFVIAHRLSTVRNSDCIMVLDHGRIIERGTHDDLIAQRGTYYQLYTGAFELD